MTTRRGMIQGALALAAANCLPAHATSITAAATPIRMAYFDNAWPFSQIRDDGSMEGILISCIDLIGHGCGLTFQHFGFPWARAQAMVQHGELDALCTVRTNARLAYAEFCATPVFTPVYGMFHRSDDLRPLQVQSIEDLRQFRLGTYRGNGYTKQYLEYDRMKIDNDPESILRRIALDDLDVMVEADIMMILAIKRTGLVEKLRFTPAPFLPSADYRFGLRRNYPEANEILARMEIAIQAARKAGSLQAAVKAVLKGT